MEPIIYQAVSYLRGKRWMAAVQTNGRTIWTSRGMFGSYDRALEVATEWIAANRERSVA